MDGSYEGEICATLAIEVKVGGQDDNVVCTRTPGDGSTCALRLGVTATLSIMPEFLGPLAITPQPATTYDLVLDLSKQIRIDAASAPTVLADVETYVVEQLHAELAKLVREAAVNGWGQIPAEQLAGGKLSTYRLDSFTTRVGGLAVVPTKLTEDGKVITTEMLSRSAQYHAVLIEANRKLLSTAWTEAARPSWIALRGLDAELIKEASERRVTALLGIAAALAGPDRRR